MQGEIINKVAQSQLTTLDLADFYTPGNRVLLDITEQLFMGQVLREKDFRAFISSNDWSKFQGLHVAVTCSADAIIPVWAYMLIATAIQPFAVTLVFGTLETLETELFRKAISEKVNPEDFRNRKVVIKGCGDVYVPVSAFVEITRILRPVADKIMYGEPCSTVPVFKKTALSKSDINFNS